MKKILTKAVSAISAFSLMATASAPGFAAKITDSKDFAVQFTSDANSHTAKIIVENTSDSLRSFDLFTAVYNAEDRSKLDAVSVKTHTVNSGETLGFESEPVNAESADAIKVYAFENLKPLEYGTDFRTLDKNAFISDLKIGDYDVNVDNENKKIYVNTTEDISGIEISDIKVSDKATCVVSDDNKTITVTSEDGLTVNTFEFICQEGIYVDFESETVGEVPSGWTVDERENCTEAVAADPFDSENKVFMLDDQANESSLKIGARFDFKTIEAPFAVSYKIMYDRDGVYADDGASATGTWLHVRNSGKNIMAVGSQDIGRELRYNVQCDINKDGTGSLSYQTKSAFENKTWHEIKMVCLSEDEAYFYSDGKLIYSGAPTYWLGVNRLHFFSSTSRTCKTYIDDILIRPYYSYDCELEKISFTDGTTSYNGIIRDGKIYVASGADKTLDISDYEVSKGCTLSFEDGVVTVESPEGRKASYPVKKYTGVMIDFESTEVGNAPAGWNLSGLTGNTATVEADPENASNKVFKLDDMTNESGTKIGAQYNFTAVKIPFSVSYKVMYNRASEYSDTGASITGTWMHVRNAGNNIVSVGSQDSGKSQVFNIKSTEGEKKSSAAINLGKWHEVEMVVMGADRAEFYVDGNLVKTDTPINALDATRLNYFSADKRTSTAYYDDIIVRPYYLDPCELEDISFVKDGENVASYIHDNSVFVNSESLEGIEAGNIEVSANCTYEFNESGNLVVTSSEGKSVVYEIIAQNYFNDDFSGFEEGTFQGTANYSIANEAPVAEGTITSEIVSENGNKILVLKDNDGNKSAGKRSMINIVKTPAVGAQNFVVEFDVKYDYVDDAGYIYGINDIGFCPMEIRNSAGKKLAGVQPRDVSNSANGTYKFSTLSGTGTSTDRTTVTVGNWYTVKIVYNKTSDTTATADYYINGKFLYTESIGIIDVFNKIFLSTSTTRKAFVSYDNIKIISLD